MNGYVNYQYQQPRREEVAYYGENPEEDEKVDFIKILKDNQGFGGLNPTTGEPRYNSYQIPPDERICQEYRVSKQIQAIP